MANTYMALSTKTIGSGGSQTIEWSAIPATYDDLLLKVSLRSSYGAIAVGHRFRINGDTSGNYDYIYEYGGGSVGGKVGSVSTSQSFIAVTINGSTSMSNTFSSYEIYIPNYATNTFKPLYIQGVTEDNSGEAYSSAIAGIWINTAAITSLSFDFGSGNTIVQYSSGTLYGIKSS